MALIRVPATTATLGPGFDSLGSALTLYAEFSFEYSDSLRIAGCPPEHAGEDNLVWRAYLAARRDLVLAETPLSISIRSAIPIARGLGSSAACAAAGMAAAWALAGIPLDRARLLTLCARMEGHPDNAAAAVLGGLRASFIDGASVYSLEAPLHHSLRFLALIPDFELSTEEARRALPGTVTVADAVYNLSRAASLPLALAAGDGAAIRAACRDRLHQPWRFPLIPGAAELALAMEEAGAAACFLSGAGPTLMCVYADAAFPDRAGAVLRAGFPRFRALPLMLCREGLAVLPG